MNRNGTTVPIPGEKTQVAAVLSKTNEDIFLP